MKFIDMHCDTLMPFVRGGDYNLFENKGQVDFQKMLKGGAMAQFFAEDDLVELTPEVRELVDKWSALTDDQKAAVWQIMKSYEK